MSDLRSSLVSYAANAVSGVGGQGEFLRHMLYTLDRLPKARAITRGSKSQITECIDIPFEGLRSFYSKTLNLPVIRRRRDLITLNSDLDFDHRLAERGLKDVSLLDGVMGQCCSAFEKLSRRNIPVVLTALNTHIDFMADQLAYEHKLLGIRQPVFVHPRMRHRALREMAQASKIRAVSEIARASFLERGVKTEAVEVIPPAIDLERFRPVPQADDVFRVLAVLTIDPRKGAYYLLQAFEKAAIPGSELVIIGATGDHWSRRMLEPFRARLRNLRLQSADVNKEPIHNTYGQASVAVHPAVEDGFALAVAQALACGKPVITTRQTGASQLIQNGQNGYVLECRDVDGLVDRLRKLAANRDLLDRMSAAAPKAVAHLSFPVVAERIINLYRKVLQS